MKSMARLNDEAVLSSIRAQAGLLDKLLKQMEEDERWKKNAAYYAREIQEVERHLRRIRRSDLEVIDI
jgi:hypothetical protein